VVEEQTVEARPEPRLFFKRLAWYRRRVESLEEQAVIDDLTGLRNQRALWRELSRRAESCSESSPLAVVMLDFDLFKEINEGYGHEIGDAVLRRAAACLRAAAPAPRLAFRYGGEEFVMLVPGDESEGRELAEYVRADIARQNGHLPAVTVSCGVAELDSPVEPWVALDRADAALRDAKRGGRNRVVAASRCDEKDSAYLVEELEHETARRAALALAVATLEVRDHNTAEHSDDVLGLCECVGRELGFDGPALERLMAGAQLHDVGKVAVPSEILNKPGPLNDDEWAVIREHTVIGERILRSVPEMAEVATIVRHSHEHWDGGGYPDGLSGEQIPLASRVVLCADAFHAIRSDRPYRAGRSAADALAEVRACAGTQFDPAVVAALGRVAAQAPTRGVSGMSLPRNKRLVLLLTTLALAGSAIAAVPELRDAVGSVFGATTPAPRGPSADDPASQSGPAARAETANTAPSPPRTTGLGERSGERSRSRSAADRTRSSDSRSRPDRRAGEAGTPAAERGRGTVRAGQGASGTRAGGTPAPGTRAGGTRAGGSPAPGTRAAETPDAGARGAPGSRTGDDTGPESRKSAGPGEYCKGESKRKAEGQARSDFSACVRAQAKRRGARRKDR
jgi:diguanylate cyclase (GGDEF)-like protein